MRGRVVLVLLLYSNLKMCFINKSKHGRQARPAYTGSPLQLQTASAGLAGAGRPYILAREEYRPDARLSSKSPQ